MTAPCWGIDEAGLSVLLDVRHPHAYLALHPADAFGREVGVEINWLPIEVPTLRAPSEPAPDDDRGIRHRRYRAQAIARGVEVYAEAQGLVLRDLYRSPDPGAFVMAWLWLREVRSDRLLDFLAEGFRAYWNVELDPGDVAAVGKLVDGLGLDADDYHAFASGKGADRRQSLATELASRGLAATPGYVIEGEFFAGRQHLPMIRWILGGRRGPGPI